MAFVRHFSCRSPITLNWCHMIWLANRWGTFNSGIFQFFDVSFLDSILLHSNLWNLSRQFAVHCCEKQKSIRNLSITLFMERLSKKWRHRILAVKLHWLLASAIKHQHIQLLWHALAQIKQLLPALVWLQLVHMILLLPVVLNLCLTFRSGIAVKCVRSCWKQIKRKHYCNVCHCWLLSVQISLCPRYIGLCKTSQWKRLLS